MSIRLTIHPTDQPVHMTRISNLKINVNSHMHKTYKALIGANCLHVHKSVHCATSNKYQQ